MQQTVQGFIDDEVEWADIQIKAAEDWGQGFKKDPKTHEDIIKAEARLQRKIRTMFRTFSEKIDDYVNWNGYYGQIKADIKVEVIVDDKLYSSIDNEFIVVTFDTVLLATTIGAIAGEEIYKVPLGIDSTDKAMMDLTTKRLAYLVGKKVDPKTGEIVDNPKASYRISDKTRADINSSIKTSIQLGEDRKAATKRLMNTIDSPRRAEIIAQTETVNAYSQGLLSFGHQSGALGKQWQDVAAHDVCAEYAAMGIIPIDEPFDGGSLQGPAAHTSCRCSLRMVYPEEFNKL